MHKLKTAAHQSAWYREDGEHNYNPFQKVHTLKLRKPRGPEQDDQDDIADPSLYPALGASSFSLSGCESSIRHESPQPQKLCNEILSPKLYYAAEIEYGSMNLAIIDGEYDAENGPEVLATETEKTKNVTFPLKIFEHYDHLSSSPVTHRIIQIDDTFKPDPALLQVLLVNLALFL